MTRLRNYKLPKYVQAQVDPDSGRAYHYFRRSGSARVRLPGLPWSPGFMAAYEKALARSQRTAGKRGTIADAVARYVPGTLDVHNHPDFQVHGWAHSTLEMRRSVLRKYARDHGHKPIASVTADELTRLLASMPPGAAENLLKVIRGLMKWCVEQGEIKTDPTVGVKLKRKKTSGHHTWTEDEIAQFEFHHAIGTKARLAFALLLYTAQRRSDVIKMGRQHIRDGVLHVKQQKTGAELAIPVHPDLQAIIDAMPSAV
jgi:hypothetical protein